jgi:hypothetical protein
MKQRLGIIKIYSDLLQAYDMMYALQRDMVVKHTEFNYAEQVMTIWCIHPAFDEVEQGLTIPEYSVIITKRNDYITVNFDRIL